MMRIPGLATAAGRNYRARGALPDAVDLNNRRFALERRRSERHGGSRAV
jgi:hypothetical protein